MRLGHAFISPLPPPQLFFMTCPSLVPKPRTAHCLLARFQTLVLPVLFKVHTLRGNAWLPSARCLLSAAGPFGAIVSMKTRDHTSINFEPAILSTIIALYFPPSPLGLSLTALCPRPFRISLVLTDMAEIFFKLSSSLLILFFPPQSMIIANVLQMIRIFRCRSERFQSVKNLV